MTSATVQQFPVKQQRTIYVGSIQIALFQIAPAIDAAIDALLNQAITSGVVQWPAFRTATQAFVSLGPPPGSVDDYFSSVTPVWNLLIQQGRFETAHAFWEGIMDAVARAENATGITVHKGSGYYFWGSNALQRGDIDQGLTLMHEAVLEDARTHGTPLQTWPDTSATKVLTLDSTSVSTHPLSWWVNIHRIALDADLTGTGLDTASFRARLFIAATSSPALISLFLRSYASLVYLDRVPAIHRDNEFVARLALSHLFHLALVLERSLAAKTALVPPHNLMAGQAIALSTARGGTLGQTITGTKKRVGNLNDPAHGGAGPLLLSLLNGTAAYTDGTAVSPTDRELAIAYVLRNQGGHEATAPAVVHQRLQDLRMAVIHAIAQCVVQYYP